jgi:PBP1b-binding outer membrane lipoprotein LpoB
VKKRTILLLSTTLFFSGCIKDVKPWEKGVLAKETMKESAINPNIKQFEEHIYFSKEASKGGGSVAGGGCGCN